MEKNAKLRKGGLFYKELTHKIIGATMEVHKELGFGFLEAVYEEAFSLEMISKNIQYESQKEIRIQYKDQVLQKRYKPDYIVEDKVIVEVKAISSLTGNEEAKILNYLRATGLKLGLLINFGAPSLEWKRMIL